MSRVYNSTSLFAITILLSWAMVFTQDSQDSKDTPRNEHSVTVKINGISYVTSVAMVVAATCALIYYYNNQLANSVLIDPPVSPTSIDKDKFLSPEMMVLPNQKPNNELYAYAPIFTQTMRRNRSSFLLGIASVGGAFLYSKWKRKLTKPVTWYDGMLKTAKTPGGELNYIKGIKVEGNIQLIIKYQNPDQIEPFKVIEGSCKIEKSDEGFLNVTCDDESEGSLMGRVELYLPQGCAINKVEVFKGAHLIFAENMITNFIQVIGARITSYKEIASSLASLTIELKNTEAYFKTLQNVTLVSSTSKFAAGSINALYDTVASLMSQISVERVSNLWNITAVGDSAVTIEKADSCRGDKIDQYDTSSICINVSQNCRGSKHSKSKCSQCTQRH